MITPLIIISTNNSAASGIGYLIGFLICGIHFLYEKFYEKFYVPWKFKRYYIECQKQEIIDKKEAIEIAKYTVQQLKITNPKLFMNIKKDIK